MSPGEPIAPSKEALQRLLSGLQTLFREHLALARVEAKEDLRGMGRDALVGAAGVPAMAAGYLLLMVAVAFLLSRLLPDWAAFGLVALANLGLGAALTIGGLGKLKRDRVELPATGEELQRDKRWLASVRSGNGGGRPWQAQ
jgi:uncharacterized membrane protein YqjE